MRVFIWILVGLLLTVSVPALAVETRGDLVVEVFSEKTEEPIAGATIVVQDRDGKRPAVTATSDETGKARVKNLPAGDYKVEVKHPEHGGDGALVKLTAGADSTFSAYLTATDEKEVITVRDQRLLVNNRDPSAGGATSRDQDFVRRQTTDNSLQSVVSTAPGVQTNSLGQLHARGEHKSVSISLDGINVPIPLSNSLTQPLEPEFLENLEIRTGHYDAAQGGQLGAVLNASTPINLEKPFVELLGRAGDRGQSEQVLRAGGSNGGFSYFVGAKRAATDLYQEPPHPDQQELNNRGEVNSFLTRLHHQGDINDFNVTLSHQVAQIELPQTPQNFDAGVRQRQNDRNTLAIVSWRHDLSDDSEMLLGISYLNSRQRINNNGVFTPFLAVPESLQEELAEERFPLDPENPGSPYLPLTDLRVRQVQPTFEYTHRLGEDHRVKAGLTANFIRSRQSLDIADPGGGGNLPNPTALPGGVTRFRADIDREGFAGGVFVSHTLPLSDTLVLNYGLRADTFDNGLSVQTNQISPLLNLSWGPTENQALRVSYNRLFQPPPLEIDLSGATETQPQRTHLYEISYENQLTRSLVGKVAYAYKDFSNQVDIGLLIPGANVPIFAPVNFARAQYQGLELSLATSNEYGWNGFLAGTISEAKPTEAGLVDEFPEFNDHDQRVQVTAGLSHRWKNGFSAATDVFYASGYPQDALPLYNSIGLSPYGLDGDRHARFITNLNFQYLPKKEDGVELGVGLKVFNLFDDRSVLNFFSEFSGTRFVRGRRILLNGQVRF